MKTSHRHFALLTGASLAALGLAMPAAAAPHDTLPDGTYPGDSTTDDSIEICDLDPTPASPCFFGVIDGASVVQATASATVSSTANGQIVQNPGATGQLLNGYETARRMRALPDSRDALIIALTGWGQEEDRRRSREAGFDHHLVKPVDFQALEMLLAGDGPRSLH